MLSRIHPADRAVWIVLALAVAVCAVRAPVVGVPLHRWLLVHLGLLFAFTIYVLLAARSPSAWVSRLARPAVTVGTVFTLYSTLGQTGLVAMPAADSVLSWIDTRVFGVSPLSLQRFQTPAAVELFSIPYAFFIPYIYLSAVLGALARPPVERDQFLAGWMTTYAVSLAGYVLVPAQGPGVFHAADYSAPLHGGAFYDLVVRGVAASGGLFGAFPSLHVGSSLYLCLFDLRTNRLRGLTYAPVVASIYAATLVLRYHYVVDLVAGTVIALACARTAAAQTERWMRARLAQGLLALPGEDAHAVLGFPTAGGDRPRRVLPADRG